MTISLQLTTKSPPLDGVLVKSQPRDLESVQSSSFHEVFKDEEKKLQKENETSTFSVAAVLAALQSAPVVESVPVLDASHPGSDIGKSDTQPALQAVSVAAQLTDVSPAPIQNGQGKTIAENKAAGIKVNTPLPVFEFPQAAVQMTGNEDTQAAIKIQPENESGVEKSALPTTDRANAASKNPVAEARAVEVQSRGVVPAPGTSVAGMALAEIQNGNQGAPIAVGANGTSEKAKSVEMQSRVLPSAPDISNTTEVMPELKNIKNDQPTSVRLKVVSEKPVVEAKTVEVRSRVAVSAPVLSGPAMDVTNIQSEYHETATVVDSEETSKMPGVEAKAVEMRPGVSASIPVNLKGEVVEFVIQNEQPAALPVVDAKETSKKLVVEAKISDVRAHGSPVPAPAMADITAALPDVQNKKTDLPAAVNTKETSEPLVVAGKQVEMQSRAAVPAPEIFNTIVVEPDVQTDKQDLTAVAGEKVTVKKPDVEIKTVEAQSSVAVSVADAEDTAMVMAESKNNKTDVPAAISSKAASEKSVVEAKTVKTQAPVAAGILDKKVVGAYRENETSVVEAAYLETGQESEPIAITTDPVHETGMVKIAEKNTAPQVNVKAAEVIQQIMHQMKARIKSGATSMRLQLNPMELGGIEVQMTRNAEGVSVTFFAEQASTGHLLETQMNQLRQSLKDAGVQLTGLNISQHDQPKQEGGFFKGHSYSNQYFQSSAPQTETANKERERQERIGGSLNEVDYLI